MSLIYIRKAAKNDLEQIMPIIDEAKKFLKEDGNPQWQSGYPDAGAINADIDQDAAWVLIVDPKLLVILLLLLVLIPIIIKLMVYGKTILILMLLSTVLPSAMSIGGCI